MSSTDDRAANRWRPTLPAPRRASAAARGLGRAGRAVQLSGLAMMAVDLGALLVLRREPLPERLATVETACLIVLFVAAIGTAANWWWSWRQATSELRDDRG